jgi:hypothetical protein
MANNGAEEEASEGEFEATIRFRFREHIKKGSSEIPPFQTEETTFSFTRETTVEEVIQEVYNVITSGNFMPEARMEELMLLQVSGTSGQEARKLPSDALLHSLPSVMECLQRNTPLLFRIDRNLNAGRALEKKASTLSSPQLQQQQGNTNSSSSPAKKSERNSPTMPIDLQPTLSGSPVVDIAPHGAGGRGVNPSSFADPYSPDSTPQRYDVNQSFALSKGLSFAYSPAGSPRSMGAASAQSASLVGRTITAVTETRKKRPSKKQMNGGDEETDENPTEDEVEIIRDDLLSASNLVEAMIRKLKNARKAVPNRKHWVKFLTQTPSEALLLELRKKEDEEMGLYLKKLESVGGSDSLAAEVARVEAQRAEARIGDLLTLLDAKKGILKRKEVLEQRSNELRAELSTKEATEKKLIDDLHAAQQQFKQRRSGSTRSSVPATESVPKRAPPPSSSQDSYAFQQRSLPQQQQQQQRGLSAQQVPQDPGHSIAGLWGYLDQLSPIERERERDREATPGGASNVGSRAVQGGASGSGGGVGPILYPYIVRNRPDMQLAGTQDAFTPRGREEEGFNDVGRREPQARSFQMSELYVPRADAGNPRQTVQGSEYNTPSGPSSSVSPRAFNQRPQRRDAEPELATVGTSTSTLVVGGSGVGDGKRNAYGSGYGGVTEEASSLASCTAFLSPTLRREVEALLSSAGTSSSSSGYNNTGYGAANTQSAVASTTTGAKANPASSVTMKVLASDLSAFLDTDGTDLETRRHLLRKVQSLRRNLEQQ